MTAPAAAAQEFFDLMCDLAEGRLSPPQAARLEELLQADPARRRQYVHFMLIVGGLHRIRGEGQAKGEGGRGKGEERFDRLRPPPSAFPLSVEPPIVIRTSPTLPTPFTFDSFVGSPLFSYMAATVIMGVGLLVFWAWKVSLHDEVATYPRAEPSPVVREMEPVGRISGMADCRWADSQDAPSAAVPLGRKYELASGLVEITYQTGAKVILQGPCTYEIDSAAGGFLALGKLTARVETKGEGGRGTAEEADNQKSPFPLPPSAFVVKTPTAIVTDLGTEFGVEVSKERTTTSTVFRGSVRVVVVGGDGRQPKQEVLLGENESVRVERGQGDGAPRLVPLGMAGAVVKFARRLVEPPETLDVLDIVAGGNGTGSRRQQGVDQSTGRRVYAFLANCPPSDHTYQATPWHKLIDGVFVPAGGPRAVQLDSAGHTYAALPATSGLSYGVILVPRRGGERGRAGERPRLLGLRDGRRRAVHAEAPRAALPALECRHHAGSRSHAEDVSGAAAHPLHGRGRHGRGPPARFPTPTPGWPTCGCLSMAS